MAWSSTASRRIPSSSPSETTVHPPPRLGTTLLSALFLLHLACGAGYQLGDNDEWHKMTNFEHATRIPLMVRLAGQREPLRISQTVESVDIFPTLVEAASLGGLQLPRCPKTMRGSRATAACTEGSPLYPLMKAKGTAAWTKPAFSQYARECLPEPQAHKTWNAACPKGMPIGPVMGPLPSRLPTALVVR